MLTRGVQRIKWSRRGAHGMFPGMVCIGVKAHVSLSARQVTWTCPLPMPIKLEKWPKDRGWVHFNFFHPLFIPSLTELTMPEEIVEGGRPRWCRPSSPGNLNDQFPYPTKHTILSLNLNLESSNTFSFAWIGSFKASISTSTKTINFN